MRFACILGTNTFLVGRYWDFNRTRENIHLNQATFPNILHPNPLLSGYVGKGYSQNGFIQAKTDDVSSEVKTPVSFKTVRTWVPDR